MRHQNMTSRKGTRDLAAAPRPLGRAAAGISKALSRAWSLPPQRNYVAVDRNRRVPMADGTTLLADHYLPITGRPAATVLVRCPYGRGLPFSLLMAQLIAERGYHVLLQSVRGTFGSGGEFEPMRNEIADGHDTVAWLRGQNWFDGRLATYGPSYLGFVQWALAMDPPPELVAMVIQVGPHDLSRTLHRNGAFELYDALGWSELIVHQEHVRPLTGMLRMVTAERRLRPALDRTPVRAGARDLLGDQAPWFESWLEHPRLTDPFWAPLQCGAALERVSVPTLLVGGWQDLFLEQTLEQYRALAARGVPTRLLIGPWTHVEVETKGGVAVAESLAWLDRYVGSGTAGSGTAGSGTAGSGTSGSGTSGSGTSASQSAASQSAASQSAASQSAASQSAASQTAAPGAVGDHSVRIWVGGDPQTPQETQTPQTPETLKSSETLKTPRAVKALNSLKSLKNTDGLRDLRGSAGEWREIADWPPAGVGQQRWYLGAGGTLGPRKPAHGDVPPARFRYDPADPTPSVGGAILALNAGMRDNRPVEQRPDVLVFSSEPLAEPVEVIGYVTAELSVTRDNPYADLFVRLCDVDSRDRSRNVCDGIVRLTDSDPLACTVRVSLLGAAHRFGRGHRLRLLLAGGAHPRFARNPGNGQVDSPAADYRPTRYVIGLGAGDSSSLALSAAGQVPAETEGKAAAHA
jgi:predicted acyl esterase